MKNIRFRSYERSVLLVKTPELQIIVGERGELVYSNLF